MLPQRLVPLRVPVAAEHVVDEYVETSMIRLDALDESSNGARVLMVDDQRCRRPAGRLDQLAGLLDRLGTVDLGPPRQPAAAPGRVHVSAGSPQLDRDRAPRAAGRSGYQGDLPGQLPFATVDHRRDLRRAVDGASLEPSGRNRWQSAAEADAETREDKPRRRLCPLRSVNERNHMRSKKALGRRIATSPFRLTTGR